MKSPQNMYISPASPLIKNNSGSSRPLGCIIHIHRVMLGADIPLNMKAR